MIVKGEAIDVLIYGPRCLLLFYLDAVRNVTECELEFSKKTNDEKEINFGNLFCAFSRKAHELGIQEFSTCSS